MRTGVFYRTDALNNLNGPDWTTLSNLHIHRDIDLRTPDEIYGTLGPPPIAPAPDVVPNGALYTNINIYGSHGPTPEPYAATPAVAINSMQAGYRAFVTDQTQLNGFRAVLLTLASDPGPDLWHCSGGKDRTGWTAMLLQSIAGVPQATIMSDYLATNSYTAALMSATKASLLAADPALDPATLDAILGVQASYLQAGLDQMTATYGSMYAYLTQGLGLTQEDIYVLRAKMVYYPMLPGQDAFVGNVASGAALLNALQNSPLSGHYTAYNYFLQSAIDAGTLWGVEAQVGGQVHADAASFLLRRSRWIDEAIAPYASGRDLGGGQTRMWMANFGGGYFKSDGDAGIAKSTEHSAGLIIGTTRRFNDQASANVGVGYDWGSVGSAGANVTLDSFLGTLGGRYGFSTLESGPYAMVRGDFAWVNYDSNRTLNESLGTARGTTNGSYFSGLAGVGNVIRLGPYTATLQTGLRLTNATVRGFSETGSELALGVNRINKTYSSILADLDISLDRQQLHSWTVTPALALGYERILGSPQVKSTGSLYGFTVSQYSAYDSRDLIRAGLGVTAQHDVFIVKASVTGVVGDGARSTGIGGQLSIGYSF